MSVQTPSSDKEDNCEKLVAASVSSGVQLDERFEKQTMRYVDLRIVPILSLVCSFASVDRSNIGSAYAAGMGTDLALSVGSRLNLVICLFFIPDILLQLPGNVLLRRFRVRNWLTFIGLSWGAVQLGMGFVRNWYELAICRVLLGAFEATLYPAMAFVMTTWYKRHEVQTRIAALVVFQHVAAALGPILAYAFAMLDGKGNLAGWRWIFIFDGLITMLIAIVTWFFIPDFPDRNSFLTREQTALVLKRIEDDRGDSVPDTFTLQKFRKHLSDWTIWAYGLMFLCCLMPAYAQGYFLPIIISEMGWPGTQALLLSAAPTAVVPISLLVAFTSDRYKHRSGFIASTTLICMTGISLLAFAETSSVRYFGAFLISAGTSACFPTIFAFSSNNVVSQSKRSVQTAVVTTAGEIGGLLGTLAYRSKDHPRYIPGLATSLVSQGVLLLTLFMTTLYLFRQNRLMKAGKKLQGETGFYYTL